MKIGLFSEIENGNERARWVQSKQYAAQHRNSHACLLDCCMLGFVCVCLFYCSVVTQKRSAHGGPLIKIISHIQNIVTSSVNI